MNFAIITSNKGCLVSRFSAAASINLVWVSFIYYLTPQYYELLIDFNEIHDRIMVEIAGDIDFRTLIFTICDHHQG